MKILIGCEESQIVCRAFRNKGHDAFSCDILPTSGTNPEWHIQEDIFKTINSGSWDLLIAHPECTRLTLAANRWYKKEYSDRFPNIHEERKQAIEFFLKIANSKIDKIAIENPIGIMSKIYKKPDQIIQPYYFGDPERKSTCLWLKNLKPLIHIKSNDLFSDKTHVEPKIIYHKSGKTCGNLHFQTLKLPKEERRKERSKTFPGIALAMANAWG